MLVALLVRCTPPPSRKKRRTTPTISIHNSRFHCYSPDDLTRRLRNLYTAGIYRSIRGATNLGVLCRKERYTMAVFSRYCPLYSPFPRSGEIILCARTKEIMLALLRSLPPLSLAVNYSYLGDGFRVPVPAMTNARLFIILSASNEQRRFRKCRFESNPLALLLSNPPLSLSRLCDHACGKRRSSGRRDNRNRDPRAGYLSPGRRLQPSK